MLVIFLGFLRKAECNSLLSAIGRCKSHEDLQVGQEADTVFPVLSCSHHFCAGSQEFLILQFAFLALTDQTDKASLGMSPYAGVVLSSVSSDEVHTIVCSTTPRFPWPGNCPWCPLVHHWPDHPETTVTSWVHRFVCYCSCWSSEKHDLIPNQETMEKLLEIPERTEELVEHLNLEESQLIQAPNLSEGHNSSPWLQITRVSV